MSLFSIGFLERSSIVNGDEKQIAIRLDSNLALRASANGGLQREESLFLMANLALHWLRHLYRKTQAHHRDHYVRMLVCLSPLSRQSSHRLLFGSLQKKTQRISANDLHMVSSRQCERRYGR